MHHQSYAMIISRSNFYISSKCQFHCVNNNVNQNPSNVHASGSYNPFETTVLSSIIHQRHPHWHRARVEHQLLCRRAVNFRRRHGIREEWP